MNSEKDQRKEARPTAEQLLRLLREVGIDRGLSIAVELVYLAWRLSHSEDGRRAWQELHKRVDGHHRKIRLHQDNLSALADDIERVPANVLREVLDVINHAPIDSGDAWLTDVVEALVDSSTLRAGRYRAEHSSPEWLAALLADLTGPGERVIDPACGYGSTLLALHSSARKVQGSDSSLGAVRIAKIRLDMAGANAQVECRDAFEVVDSAATSFDVVSMHPPWGMTLTDEQRQNLEGSGVSAALLSGTGPRSGIAWVVLASMMLRAGGHAAVVLPMTASRPSAALNEVLDLGIVEAVISLPQRFWSGSPITGHIWLMRPMNEAKEQLLMVNGASLAHRSRPQHVALASEARAHIADILERFRNGADLKAAEYVARVVEHAELDPRAGIGPVAYLEPAPEEPQIVPEPAGHLIQRINVAGYKSYGKSTSASLAPITLVYGPNSSGKSSLIQSLLLLRQSLEEPRLITQGRDADVGSFHGVRHRRESQEVTFGLTFGAPVWTLPEGGTADPSELREMSFTFADEGEGRGELTSASIYAGPFRTEWTSNGEGVMTVPVAMLENVFSEIAKGSLLYPPDNPQSLARETTDAGHREQMRRTHGRMQYRSLHRQGLHELAMSFHGLIPAGRSPRLPPWNRTEGEQFQLQKYLDRTAQLATGIGLELKTILEDMVYLGPLRSAPQRIYSRTAAGGPPGDGSEAALTLFDSRSALTGVNRWFHSLEIPYEVGVLPLGTGEAKGVIGDLMALTLKDVRSGIRVSPVDVGYGISQVMPIVIELATRDRALICIEQPETHLHPRLQARLGDLFLEATRSDGQANQLVVETHSEHLILRIQRRIREERLDPNAVAVLYVDQDDQGEAIISRLRIDEDGDFIDEWPGGFFDERLEELFGGL